jgi:hypothetical protein
MILECGYEGACAGLEVLWQLDQNLIECTVFYTAVETLLYCIIAWRGCGRLEVEVKYNDF